MPVPVLRGEAKRAAAYRGGHLQIVATAGSGKTEVVSQRVAGLLAEGVLPDQIVAFTFTERAAASLKDRIATRVLEAGTGADRDRLSRLYVGTIHAYCFQLLQTHVPKFETYDVLDSNRLTAFLAREAQRLGLKALDPQHRLFASINLFLRGMDVVENELLDVDTLPDPFGTVARAYLDRLERYRLLTFGQQIASAVQVLSDPQQRKRIAGGIKHLIVDEYQDVNPAQERLVQLLAKAGASVCVVGDDDQAIYQWRGSDVANIVTFERRYKGAAQFTIAKNYRSRPDIVTAARDFAATIPGRLPKHMQAVRGGAAPEVSTWSAPTEAEEAELLAGAIQDLHAAGCPYRDIAVLARGRVAYPRLLEAFAAAGIPVQPAGRTGLFDQAEALTLSKTYCWLVDVDWRPSGFGTSSATISDAALRDEYRAIFGLAGPHLAKVTRLLGQWKAAVADPPGPIDLIDDYYSLLHALRVRDWNHDDPVTVARLGTLARFSTLLADYEAVRTRARMDENEPGYQVGGQNMNTWYYKNLAFHLLNHAQGAYEGYDGEPLVELDAVDLTTVHSAKGLEWPAVFVPSLTAKRFPSSKTGSRQSWPIPRALFPADRYEGSDTDERRLFFVAMTRAKDWISLSRHDTPHTSHVAPSRYFTRVAQAHPERPRPTLPRLAAPARTQGSDPLIITFSELSAYQDCGAAFRLRNLLGFQPRLAPELGYGKAVHHVLRTVAEHVQAKGRMPTSRQIDAIFDADFYLPAANKPAHRQMKAAARRLIDDYITNHADDLHRVWQTERPFELHLDDAVVTGRADVILDYEDGVAQSLALVDYKTTVGDAQEHALQLRVYADAGQREGLQITGAYVHGLVGNTSDRITVSDADLDDAERIVNALVADLRARRFDPRVGPGCKTCDVRRVCHHAP